VWSQLSSGKAASLKSLVDLGWFKTTFAGAPGLRSLRQLGSFGADQVWLHSAEKAVVLLLKQSSITVLAWYCLLANKPNEPQLS